MTKKLVKLIYTESTKMLGTDFYVFFANSLADEDSNITYRNSLRINSIGKKVNFRKDKRGIPSNKTETRYYLFEEQ